MTVEQLTEVLARLPGHVRIVVDGYEGGYEEPVLDAARVRSREPDGDESWWLGSMRGAGREESGEVALVVGRGAGDWLHSLDGAPERAEVLAAIHPEVAGDAAGA